MKKLKEYLSNIKNWVTIFFILVPFISSVISAFHIYEFLNLGNQHWVAITGAITFEIANIAIIFALVTMKKLNPIYVWITFTLLVVLQYLGNIYYSYNYVYEALRNDNNFIVSFLELTHIGTDNKLANFILSLLLGIPFPTLSILLSKSLVDYLDEDDDEEFKIDQIKILDDKIIASLERIENLNKEFDILKNQIENQMHEIFDEYATYKTEIKNDLDSNLSKKLDKKDKYILTEINSGKNLNIKLQ